MTKKPLSFRYILLATLLGNTLEWYEFACFSLLAHVFSHLFFPQSDPILSAMHTLLGLAFGYVFRPLGGILFGYIGDRFGRKAALIASVLLMSFPTLGIGLLPTYAQIGFSAAVLVSILRMFQGLAAGGELPGSMTFIVESAPPEKRGFYGSFVFFGVILGVLIGAAEWALFSLFPESHLYSWGWRSMYIFGALLGCAAFLLRYKLHETAPFQGLKESHEILKDPTHSLFKNYKLPLLKLIGLGVLETAQFNILISFFIIYSFDVLNLNRSEIVALLLFYLLCLTLLIPLAGWLSSRFGLKKMALFSSCGMLLFSWPLYALLQHPFLKYPAAFAFALLTSAYMAPLPALFSELFPAKVRLSGIGFGYNATVGFIGGILPLLSLFLIKKTGSAVSPALLLMISALISLITLNKVRRTERDSNP